MSTTQPDYNVLLITIFALKMAKQTVIIMNNTKLVDKGLHTYSMAHMSDA